MICSFHQICFAPVLWDGISSSDSVYEFYCNNLDLDLQLKESSANHQKRAVRIITHSNPRTHTSPLFSRLQLLKLHDIYKLEVAKLMHRVYNKSLNTLNAEIHNARTYLLLLVNTGIFVMNYMFLTVLCLKMNVLLCLFLCKTPCSI